MAMLYKWAAGYHVKDNIKNDSAGNAVIQASGDFKYELPNTEPSEAAGTVGAADTPYTLEKAKQYTAAAEKNVGRDKALGGKADGTSVIAVKKLGWYNLYRMVKWRKILKNRNKVGVNPDAPTTLLYAAQEVLWEQLQH